MKKSLISLAVVGTAFAMTACTAPDNNNRTTTLPRMVSAAAAANDPTAGYDAPPAPRELGPVPANANKIAPGTDPEKAFADRPNYKDMPAEKMKGASADAQHREVMAEDAAVRAPDTASGDAAKKEVLAGENGDSGSPSSGNVGAGSSKSSDESTRTTNDRPRHGALTKDEESNKSPKEGQVNNHSSTDLEKDSGRPSDGTSSK